MNGRRKFSPWDAVHFFIFSGISRNIFFQNGFSYRAAPALRYTSALYHAYQDSAQRPHLDVYRHAQSALLYETYIHSLSAHSFFIFFLLFKNMYSP